MGREFTDLWLGYVGGHGPGKGCRVIPKDLPGGQEGGGPVLIDNGFPSPVFLWYPWKP